MKAGDKLYRVIATLISGIVFIVLGFIIRKYPDLFQAWGGTVMIGLGVLLIILAFLILGYWMGIKDEQR